MKASILGKFLGIVISASLLASLSVSSVSAQSSFTAGDSIAAGVGPVAAGESSFESFAGCVDDYLQNSGLTDSGVSVAKIGATSAEILDQVKNTDSLADSKYIMISSGGNDFLDLLEEAVAPYMEDGDTLTTLTPEKTAALTQKISADQTAFMGKLSGVTAVTEEAAQNAAAIVAAVKEKAPDAEIYFLENFNPFDAYSSSDDDTIKIIGSFSDSCIRSYNRKLAAIDGIHLVPVFNAFAGRPDDFIRQGDVHPTEAGHIRIAELIISDITGEDNDTILSNMIKYRMINGATFRTLPEDMRSDIDVNKIIEDMFNAVTTAATTTEEPVLTTPADTTTSEVTTPAVSKKWTIPANGGGYVEEITTATTSETPAASDTTVSVNRASSSPATSDRGISPVIISGLFSAAAVCLMARKKRD